MPHGVSIWSDMFALGLPVLEKIVRSVVVYLFLVIALRLAGKRELAQLNTLDFIVLLTLSNTVQNAIIGNDNSVTGGLIGAATLLAINFGLVRLTYQNRFLTKLLEGHTSYLIDDGQLQHRNLKRELMTPEELESVAHKQGFDSLNDIQRAVLEPGGTISFTRKPVPEDPKLIEIGTKLDQILTQLNSQKAS